jgi:hypothetical protein
MPEIPGAESKTDPHEDQFSRLAEKLLDIMHKYPYYYGTLTGVEKEVEGQTHPDRMTNVLDELNAAKAALENSEIAPGHQREINLFTGFQSRNVDNMEDRQNSELIEQLYIALNELAGYYPMSYHDIELDALDLARQNLLFEEKSEFKYMMPGDRLALAHKGNPVGVQLKVSDNIFAAFELGNFGKPMDSGTQMSRVLLHVVPTEG